MGTIIQDTKGRQLPFLSCVFVLASVLVYVVVCVIICLQKMALMIILKTRQLLLKE